jgi:hypothetical protein
LRGDPRETYLCVGKAPERRREDGGMRRPGVGAERLVGLFLIGAIGFSPPILTLFDKPILVAGIPLLYLYLFALWIVLIALASIVVTQLAPADDPRRDADDREHKPDTAANDGA